METFEIPILEAGVSQLYLNQRKLEAVKNRSLQEGFDGYGPLPVYDFGDGRPTLTDGHHRAFAAWQLGRPTLTVYWDTDPNVTSKLSQKLYRMALEWCRDAGVTDLSKLQGRVLQPTAYEFFWLERCRRGHQIQAVRDKQALEKAAELAPGMRIYGVERDLSAIYFEDAQGKPYKYYDGELKPERGDTL